MTGESIVDSLSAFEPAAADGELRVDRNLDARHPFLDPGFTISSAASHVVHLCVSLIYRTRYAGRSRIKRGHRRAPWPALDSEGQSVLTRIAQFS